MDAFDKVRELAREKYEEAQKMLPAGYKAIDLVKVLADKADLQLYGLNPTDPLLNGALAVLVRGDGAIYHVDNVSREDLAVLIAHELGHFNVHLTEFASSCSSDDVDVSAPTEASPVGADRVAGYGARERRELQANVFARELLLPRPQARAMYLDGGKTPKSIASELGLPIAVARQQLIDALLIPEEAAPQADKPERVTPGLDASQAEAAMFSGAPLLLEAGPGTGKTRTLVARIVHLLESGTTPSSIVALTFSNKAAQELSERVAAAVPDAAANVWTGTFHSFGLEFVRKHYDHPKLGYPPNVGIVDRSDAVGLLEDLLPVLSLNHYKNYWDPLINLKDILSAISRAKDELVSPERYRMLAQTMLDKAANDKEREAADKALEVAEVYARYEEVLNEHKLLDFGDLIMKPTLVLEEDATLRAALQLQYRNVLIDEYQDVNRASARLLKALAGDAKGLWVVGDARQSIYRFRGASSANMAKFESDFPGAKRLSLRKNYRSTQEITDAYCGFSRAMAASKGMLDLDLQANRGASGVVPDLRQVTEEDEEEAAAAASVRELEAAGVPLRDQAMLFRTNSRLSDFAVALESRGIPVLHLGSLFEREEIRDLLSLLSLMVDPWGNALIRVAGARRYGVPLADVTSFLTHRRGAKAKALDALKDAGTLEDLSEPGKRGFAALAADLDRLGQSSSPWDVLCTYLFERAHVLKSLAVSHEVRDQMKCVAIWQFLNFVREPTVRGRGSPIFRLLERIRRLVILGDERDLRHIPASAQHANAIRMLTMHGAKGLEFEAVHVPGLTRNRIPLGGKKSACPPPDGMVEDAESASGEDYGREIRAAEEECLYFVTMSRARSWLRHYGSAAKPSDFIPKVSPALEVVRPVPLAPKRDSVNEWISPTTGTLGPIDADRLNRFEDCARRFLYTHILGLGGRQRESPFLKAHDCVYETLRAAKAHEGLPDKAHLLGQLDSVWKERGPVDDPYAKDYRRIAEETISNFHAACQGLDLQKVETLAVELDGTVHVNPDQVAVNASGMVLLRRIKTGKVPKDPKDEEDEWIYTLYHLSASKRYGSGQYAVEAVHLTSNTCTPIAPSAKKMTGRKEKVAQTIRSIRAGAFPPKRDDFSCPRCPHFFYCPALPEGAVQLP
jgi:DNA helicase-2/ATP-dependent DNA helicase PcrA